MLKLLGRIGFSLVSNAIALWAAAYLVVGFEIVSFNPRNIPINFGDLGLYNFLSAVAVFTLLNIFVRPIFRLILTPIIFLTFGLGIIVLNMLILYLSPLFFQGIHIAGLGALFYATLIIGAVNILTHIFIKNPQKN